MKIFEPTIKPKNKRLKGGWREPLYPQLENQLVKWIYDRRSNALLASRKLIMTKAKYSYESECNESEKSLFVASNRWVNNFMCHNGFLLLYKTITTQQDSEQLIDKLIILHAHTLSIKYNYPPSSITAMDKISVWNDMVSNTTIDKSGICLFEEN